MREISLIRSLSGGVIGPLAALGLIAAVAAGEPVTESAVVQPQSLPPDYWFGRWPSAPAMK